MPVARQVGQHCLGPGERALGIDHPLAMSQRRHPAREGIWFRQRRILPEQTQLAGAMGRSQRIQEAPPEQAREYPHGRKNPRLQAIQRVPSVDRPPPGMIPCT